MAKKTEKETRKWMLEHAKHIGAEEDLKNLFTKWDKLLSICPEENKVEMSRMAILEVQALLDIHPETGDGLTINNEIIVPEALPEKKWKNWNG